MIELDDECNFLRRVTSFRYSAIQAAVQHSAFVLSRRVIPRAQEVYISSDS